MNSNARIIKNSGILYIKLIVTSVMSLFTSRLVFQSLGASDFGLYGVVGGIVVIINIFNTMMISTTYRYIAFEMGKNDFGELNKIFNISLVLHACLAFTVVSLAETFGKYYILHYLNVPTDRIHDAIFIFDISVLATFFSILSVPFQGLIVAQEKFSIQAAIEIISCVLRLCVAIAIFYYIGNKLQLYSIFVAIVTVFPSVIYVLYCRKKYAFIISWSFQRDKLKYKEMISYSSWLFLGTCAYIGRIQGSAVIINLFFGTVLNASFAIANQLNSLVLMFAQNLSQATIPQITKSYSSGNSERMTQLACYISKYSFFLMLLPALPILLETNFLLSLWMGKVPDETSLFCQLMIVNALLDSMVAGLPAVIQATGKIKYFQIILSTISLLSLPLTYIFFKNNYPPYTILMVYLVTAFINIFIWQVLLKIVINFDIMFLIKKSYLRIIYVGVLVSPLFYIKNLYPDDIIRFVFLSMLAVFWLIIVVYFIGMEMKERKLIAITLKGFIN